MQDDVPVDRNEEFHTSSDGTCADTTVANCRHVYDTKTPGWILTAAGVTFAGTLGVARGTAIRSWRPHPVGHHATGLGPLRTRGFVPLLCAGAGLGAAFGIVGVAVPAYATASHSPHAAGVLLAVWGIGSAAGGIWYGTRRPSRTLHRQFVALLAGVAASIAVLAVMPGPVALGVALVVGGVTIAPALTVQNSLVGLVTPARTHNEAYTWMTTLAVAASAAGSAATGVLVDRPGGVRWAFLAAGVAIALGAVVAARSTGLRPERPLSPVLTPVASLDS
jgi:MFS family permease